MIAPLPTRLLPLRVTSVVGTGNPPTLSAFSHVMVGANDVAASKKFDDAILGALGHKPGVIDDKDRCYLPGNLTSKSYKKTVYT